MALLDLLFPRKCVGCGRTGGYFCSQCLNYLSLESNRICPVCEKPSIGGLTHPRCHTLTALDGLTSVFSYRGIIKTAITKLKYKFVSDLASDLVEAFLSFCGENKVFSQFCQQQGVSLVPIPLHPTRLRWRGFNQAELLGRMIAGNLGIDFRPDLLRRVKNTTPQIKLSEKQRRLNIRDAFSISPNSKFMIHNSNLILFDDVWTSGATLREATKVLKRSGVKTVWGLTVAR